jgi:lipopolysaccharide transport protein LptA
MDTSLVKPALLAACAAWPCLGTGQQAREAEEIVLDAGPLSFDRDSNEIHIQGVKITQGDISIEAGDASATGLDFEDNEWRFTGGVRIVVDSIVLEADSAIFTFKANELTTGNLEGTPASFTDQSPSRERRARGSANKLLYDYADRTLRMTDDAWLNQGTAEVRGCDLIYDFDEEEFASGSADCGVRITYRRQRDDAANTDAAPAP